MVKKQGLFIGILLISVFIILVVLSLLNPGLLWDENAYLANARAHTGQSSFTEDFRFPLLEYILSAFFFLFGGSILLAKMIIIAFTLLTIYLAFLIAREYFKDDENSSTIKKLMIASFALSPLVIIWGFRVYADIPTLFFIILSFFFIIKSEKGSMPLLYISLAGAASALAFLARFPSLIFGFCILVYLLFRRDYKKLILFVLLFLLILAPWLLYNYQTYGYPVWDLKAQYNVVDKFTSPAPVMNQVSNLFTMTGIMPILMIFSICLLAYSMIKHKKYIKSIKFLVLGYTLLSIIYYLFFVNLKDSRYYLMILPFIYLIAFECYTPIKNYLAKVKFSRVAKNILIIVIILNIILLFAYGLAYSSAQLYCGKDAIQESINYLKPFAEDIKAKNETVISNFWPYMGYGLNVKTASIWSKNLNEIFSVYRVRYIVYSDRFGAEYNKTILDNNSRLALEKEFSDKCRKIFIYKQV